VTGAHCASRANRRCVVQAAERRPFARQADAEVTEIVTQGDELRECRTPGSTCLVKNLIGLIFPIL
jgi:hypothetical protein